MDDSDLLALRRQEHERAPFPPHLRGRDVDGQDMVMLDADIAGCVHAFLTGRFDERHRRVLLRLLPTVERILPALDDEGDAFRYYDRLREMAVVVLRESDARPTSGRRDRRGRRSR
ncbi:hypothetical protein FHX81_6872 [Saccharothrix saharensis]|uniref:Uncharacterized protein n=1 Tax=Saccharothrix saharensis TaxID=571190 RepID=A0A543JNJ4_9PSEU|nr:hypothetical protein [Saccharothrix saharensis]TQM84427.1 hypothetical protein FHX81_6872 [Saccharothrix saharensis]